MTKGTIGTVSLSILLAFVAGANATTMEDSRGFFSFIERAPGSGQYATGGGQIYETAGVNTSTVNIAATATATAQSTVGALGQMDPDGRGAGFWSGGSMSFGTGLSNEFNLAGETGMSIVWRMNGTSTVRWGAEKYILVARYSASYQYRISLSASGANSVLVYTTISGPGSNGWYVDMTNDFNMLQWANYALTYDGSGPTGKLTFFAWGDDGDFYTYTKDVTAGAIGDLGGNPTLNLGSNGATATGMAGTIMDGFAIFDTALTKTQIENLTIPEPVTMVMCLLGGGLMMLKRRGR